MTVPIISSISPKLAPNDFSVNIRVNGNGFDVGVVVYIGTTLCTNISRVSASDIRCDIPAGVIPGTYDITVVNPTLEQDILKLAFRVMYPQPDPLYASETLDVIRNRILQGFDTKYDISPASFIYALVSQIALELTRAYIRADDITALFFPQTSRGAYLDQFGESHGILREPSIRAEGFVRITGTNGTVIPVGTQFSTVVSFGQTATPIIFETLAAGIISAGTVDIVVRALGAGAAGDVGPHQITRLMSGGIVGISGIDNPNSLTGGQDVELDDDYRARELYFMANPAAAGNKADYELWALEVAGVSKVVVFPLARGNGTVNVGILGTTFPFTGANATAILSITGQPTNGQTVTIDGKVYTFQTSLNAGNGNVKIGTSASASRDNLVSAINLDDGVGVVYGTGTTVHPTVKASGIAATQNMLITYKRMGVVGNAVSLAEGITGTWSASTMAGGIDPTATDTTLIAAVQSYIAPVPITQGNGKAPIGADVLVIAPDLSFVSVSVTTVIASGFNAHAVHASVEQSIRQYLLGLPIGDDVIWVNVANVVHDTPGVANYSGLLVNGAAVDVVITSSQKTIDGIVTVA